MEFSRIDRLQSEFVKDISAIVSDELRDRPPAMITFTRAEITRDLKFAKIYFSAFGQQDSIDASLEYLKRHAGVIRRMIGQRMRIRYTPELSFIYDVSIEQVIRINEILEQIKKDEKKS